MTRSRKIRVRLAIAAKQEDMCGAVMTRNRKIRVRLVNTAKQEDMHAV